MLIFKERKALRAEVIIHHALRGGYTGIICFSCGNASRELRERAKPFGLPVIEICPGGDLQAERWWLPEEVHKAWPDWLDGTSGHLPLFLMCRIAETFREHLGELLESSYEVPTGSGETITCLRFAYSEISFKPIYGINAATAYEEEAPLNKLVAAMSVRGKSGSAEGKRP